MAPRAAFRVRHRPAPSTGSGAGGGVEVKGRLVNLQRNEQRINGAGGGHAVVLLTNAPATQARNRAACEALVLNFESTTYAQTQVGLERESDGRVVAIRPIYWPVDSRIPAGAGDRCATKLRQYDYARAASIRQRLELTEPGPFLVVSTDDQLKAGTIDMSRLTPAQIQGMVVYFRDHFSQQGTPWVAESVTPQARRSGLMVALGQSFVPSLVNVFSTFAAPAAMISSGCASDTRDTRICPRTR